MKTIHILYGQFFDHDGNNLLIGGVETYIRNLSMLLNENGYSVNIYQYSNKSFQRKIDSVNVYGIVTKSKKEKNNYNCYKTLVKFAETNGNLNNDILLFGADLGIVKTKFKNVIAIQHGIGWDIQPNCESSIIVKIKYFIKNCKIAIEKNRKYKYCNKIVCVDYNFVNWYRSLIVDDMSKLFTIPNFTKVPKILPIHKSEKEMSIVFARRFQKYRGTVIFAEAIEKLYNDGYKFKVIFAGEGAEETYLKNKFKNNNSVLFVKFHPDDSINFHQQYDIAVLPSIGSEGTSLSLLEAMASGCAVISTDIGGLTNIVLDNYNGLIVRPDSESIYNAILKLSDKKTRDKLTKNAYDTIINSFSYEKWSNAWLEIVEKEGKKSE